MITSLLTAPTEAVVNAASEQRRIWIKWLKDVERILASVPDSDVDTKRTIIQEHLHLAPVWKMSAQISISNI